MLRKRRSSLVERQSVDYSAGPRADWGRELRTKEMFRQNKIRKLVVITPAQLAGPTKQFLGLLNRAVANMKWDFGETRVLELENDRALSYINKVDTACSQIEPDFFLIVLPRNSLDRYAAVKQKCTCDRGVLTQFVLAKQLMHKNAMSIATNIAIQMNAKHRGAPWVVPIPLKDIMVIGYDVSRDTVNKGRCFGAMLASMDPEITQFRQAVFEHKNEEELSDYISQQTYIFASLWKKLRGYFPKKVLFYRDGVGDGQLEYVRVYEVEEIVRKLTELYGDKSLVKLAFVVVSKRINVKFFTKDNENPPPGTVVDTVVTQPERYDFYLTSQCVNQGTVSPTSYNIIYDTMGLPSDKMQILTNKLTHMYFNWSGTIKVPAPVQYAHKLAFQTSQALHRPAHAKLQDTLHFL